MWDILRYSATGQVLRFLSIRKGLLYLEEDVELELPSAYTKHLPSDEKEADGRDLRDDKADQDDEEAAMPKGLEQSATLYIMLLYGILYSFFESFPIVYTEMYGLNLGETGLLFLCICVSPALAVPAYMGYLYFVAIPAMRTQPGVGSPEARLLPGVIGSFLVFIGLFIFAWTARRSINYFVSLLGVLLSFAGVFPIIQSMFLYLAFTCPMYAASLFAANDCARSTFAAAAVLFSTPMYDRLGVDGGVSLLAGLTVLCIVGMFVLYFFGANLRARSRFAVKPNL